MNSETDSAGLRLHLGYLDRDAQKAVLAAISDVLDGGAAIHAAYAELRPADVGANVKLRTAGLGHG